MKRPGWSDPLFNEAQFEYDFAIPTGNGASPTVYHNDFNFPDGELPGQLQEARIKEFLRQARSTDQYLPLELPPISTYYGKFDLLYEPTVPKPENFDLKIPVSMPTVAGATSAFVFLYSIPTASMISAPVKFRLVDSDPRPSAHSFTLRQPPSSIAVFTFQCAKSTPVAIARLGGSPSPIGPETFKSLANLSAANPPFKISDVPSPQSRLTFPRKATDPMQLTIYGFNFHFNTLPKSDLIAFKAFTTT
jgi:hypothetical protein